MVHTESRYRTNIQYKETENVIMAKVISIAIQKGGCAKTTTSITLGSCLADKGNKVLLVDVDPQGNLSYGVGCEEAEYTIYDVLSEQYDKRGKDTDGIRKAIIKEPENCNFDVVPANIYLAGSEGKFTDVTRTYLLRDVLKKVENDYDYIIIDCPPSLGVLTLNAFTASEYIIIPMEPSYFALQGLEQLSDTITDVKMYCNNPNLKILGILLTRYTKRMNITKVALEEIYEKAKDFEMPVFKSKIAEAVVIKESQALQVPLVKHEPSSKSYQEYMAFAEEVIKGVQ